MSNPAITSAERQSRQPSETTTIRPQTRSQSSAPHKSRADLIHKSQSIIKDQDAAQRWLTKQELVIPGEQITVANLTMALLYISNGKYDQKGLINSSRAVAICLGNLNTTPNPDEIAIRVTSTIEPKLAVLDNQIKEILRYNNTQIDSSSTADSTQQALPLINSKEQATEYFTNCGVFNPDSPTNLNITQFLLQLSTTNGTPTNVKDGICASALLIENKNTDSSTTANNITDLIKQQMDDITRQLITKTNTLHNLVQDVTSTATTIKDNTMKTVTHLNQSTPATYAAVAQAATNSEHADIIARGLNADKQLLIFADKTLSNADPTDLTKKDLVTKANMALELMDDTPTNKLEIVSLITAKKLCNGNILFQLNSTQATAWLRNPDVQKEFLLTYSSNVLSARKQNYARF